MHILHVIDGLGLGGAERMLVSLANRAAVDGHRVSVCVTRGDTTLANELATSIALIRLGRTRRWELEPMRRLAKVVRETGVDVIHCHGRSSFSLVAVLVASRRVVVPVLLQDHLGVELHPRIPRWFRFARYFLDVYVGLYAQHETWARRAGIRTDRIHVIPNALDLRTIDPAVEQLPQAPGCARLVAVGGLRPEKGLDVLFEAIAQLERPVRLFVIGGDIDRAYAQMLRDRAACSDLSSRIVFLGTRRDALALARSADLAVHAARSESGPLVLLEYAAREVPFVATSVGGIATGLQAAGIGRFVAPERPVALASQIDAALALSAEQRRAEARAWRDAAIALYDLTIVMPRWYSLYEQLARAR
ncbi:MAG: glycosyltransferase [Kofleriaceae bacterium]